MNVRPILFSAPMVRALLEGRKTQTRRIVKFPIYESRLSPPRFTDTQAGDIVLAPSALGDGLVFHESISPGSWHCMGRIQFVEKHCPYGKPGDLLWVREACRNWRAGDVWKSRWLREADGSECATFSLRAKPGKRASMHMPRRDSRLTLRIRDVRVERLGAISHDDCCAEGIESTRGGEIACLHRFAALWNSINGAGAFEQNPWAWAISFEVIRANVDAVAERQVR